MIWAYLIKKTREVSVNLRIKVNLHRQNISKHRSILLIFHKIGAFNWPIDVAFFVVE